MRELNLPTETPGYTTAGEAYSLTEWPTDEVGMRRALFAYETDMRTVTVDSNDEETVVRHLDEWGQATRLCYFGTYAEAIRVASLTVRTN